jgi:hypothetical protein
MIKLSVGVSFALKGRKRPKADIPEKAASMFVEVKYRVRSLIPVRLKVGKNYDEYR